MLLDPLLERLQVMDEHIKSGVPFEMGWRMYRGPEIYKPTAAVYALVLQQGMVTPCKIRLEDKLRRVKGEAFLRERLDLKTYLMMSDVEHLDIEWETGKLTALWAEILRPTSNIAESDLRAKLKPHVRYYLKLVQEKRVAPLPHNGDLVEQARKTLMNVPVEKRYYDLFVNAIIDEKYDEAGEDVHGNLKFPPVRLLDLFLTRPNVLKVIKSARFEKEKVWKEVEGPYTETGHYAVLQNVKEGVGLLERDRWIVPLGPDEGPERIPTHLRRLAEDYQQRYIEQWTNWMLDLKVQSPATVKEAIELYRLLVDSEQPYLTILRRLEDHTQWKKPPELLAKPPLKEQAERLLNEKATQATGGLRWNVKIDDINKMGDKVIFVPSMFKRTVEFGNPPAGSTGANVEPPLTKYLALLDKLRRAMQKAEDDTPDITLRAMSDQLEEASKQVPALLQPFDEKAKKVLTPLLQDPLTIAASTLPPPPVNSQGKPGAVVRPSRRKR